MHAWLARSRSSFAALQGHLATGGPYRVRACVRIGPDRRQAAPSKAPGRLGAYFCQVRPAGRCLQDPLPVTTGAAVALGTRVPLEASSDKLLRFDLVSKASEPLHVGEELSLFTVEL